MPVNKPPKVHSKTIGQVVSKTDMVLDVNASPNIVDLYKGGCPPTCPECHGQSFFTYGNVPVGHKYFGVMFPCTRLPMSSAKRDFDTGLIGKDREHHFNDIEVLEGSNILEAVQAIVSMLEKRRGFILLYGGYGLGKTLLLKIAVSEVVRANDNRFARYRLMPRLLNEMRDIVANGASVEQILDMYARFDMLAIDELGVAKNSEWVAEQQFMLINDRYEATLERGEDLMTIVATNNSLSELPPRLVDRWMDGRAVAIELKGDSFRPLQRSE